MPDAVYRFGGSAGSVNYRLTARYQQDEGFDRTRTRAIGDLERVLYTAEGPAHVAKNRLGLPEERAVRVEILVSAYVPADYIALEANRIDLHRRIARARDEAALLAVCPVNAPLDDCRLADDTPLRALALPYALPSS